MTPLKFLQQRKEYSGKEVIKKVISKKKQMVEEAREKAKSSPYHGCATAVFTAVADVLGLKHGDEVFKAMIGLAGGTGHFTKGTCGCLTGATAAISLSYDLDRQEVLRLVNDPKELHPEDPRMPKVFQEIFDKTAEVARRIEEKYGGILCSDVQFKIYGKTLDILDPKKHWEFCQAFRSFPVCCFDVEADVAGWAVETILKGKS